jgi:hypothetical protein
MIPIRNASTALKTQEIIEAIFGSNLHKKRQLSLAYAAMGVLGSGTLFLHDLGLSLATTLGKNKKHTTKQIDRLLSNKGISGIMKKSSWFL